MSTRVVDRVEDWNERSFTGGYHTLAEFEDSEFSGVVRVGGAELFLTKGTPVGIRNGTIEDFEDASGTAYVAPSPALPLLAIMQETSDEARAEYYSEKTAIAEVDSTLSDGGFTGYVELSDNVLSGDYYQVYHGGTSMSVGFIGQSARLVDGDEAFETANDEVGIYQVYPAEIDVIEIPADSTPSGGASATEDATTTGVDDSQEAHETSTESETSTAAGDTADATQATETTNTAATPQSDEVTTDTTQESAAPNGEPAEATEHEDTESSTAAGTSTSDQQPPGRQAEDATTDQHDDGGSASQSESRQNTRDPQTEPRREPETDKRRETASEPRRETAVQSPQEPQDQGRGRRETDSHRSAETPGSEIAEEEYSGGSPSRSSDGLDTGLETKAIPSLDPTRTVEQDDTGHPPATPQNQASEMQRSPDSQGQSGRDAGQSTGDSSRTQTAGDTVTERSHQPSTDATRQSAESEPSQSTGQSGQVGTDSDPSVRPERLAELEAELDERETEIERLESELDRKATEHEGTKDQLDAVREERDELQAEVGRLESELDEVETELDRLETQFGAATNTERRMTPSEALAQTDLLPRYDSKGDATLEKAHSGSHRAEDVVDNLNILTNPQFEEDSVSVGGQTYREFIESTLEYRFVQWVIRDLLFEIRETGHEKALRNLYDAIPDINRIDLDGVVDVVYSQDGQETRSQESFDIVFRDRMGEPLVVANLNDSRQEASQEMMETLVRSAERVGQSVDEFASAFLVTRGVFEPAALNTAEEATKGGLFSRDKRRSFVNLSRKKGYHLCLVEAPEENFSLLVPEL